MTDNSMVTIHGLPWLRRLGITENMVGTFPRLPARKDDIFIVSYPRSGSTWTQEIVWQILHDGKIDYRRLDIRVPFIEGMILSHKPFPYVVKDAESMEKMFDSFPCPRVFKTHLTYGLVPKGQDEATKPRYIYVMRNPKDAAVSFYHLRRNIPFLQENCSWDEFFEKFMKGEVLGGVWFDHVLSWWEHRDDPNILFLGYEERIKDPADAIQRIAQFIGKDLSPESLDLIVRQTSFGAMKNSDHVNYSWFEGMKGDGHIRKGQTGAWRDYFTEEQNELFDKMFKEKMQGTGITFEFHDKPH